MTVQLVIESLINKRYTCWKNEFKRSGLTSKLCVAFSRFYKEHLVFLTLSIRSDCSVTQSCNKGFLTFSLSDRFSGELKQLCYFNLEGNCIFTA